MCHKNRTFPNRNSKIKKACSGKSLTGKGSNWNDSLLRQANLPLLTKVEYETFPETYKLKETMATKPALDKILQGILHTKKRLTQQCGHRNEDTVFVQ